MIEHKRAGAGSIRIPVDYIPTEPSSISVFDELRMAEPAVLPDTRPAPTKDPVRTPERVPVVPPDPITPPKHDPNVDPDKMPGVCPIRR